MLSRRRLATLAFTLAAVALVAPSSAQAADCPGADVVPAADNLAQTGQTTLCLLNAERGAHGLRPVSEAPRLTAPSAAYSARMVAESFFAHVSPDGGDLVDRLVAAGYVERDGDWAVGENIAWGQAELATPRSIVAAWMASPGHRANILTGEYTEIGVGVVLGTPGDLSWGATYTTNFGAIQRGAAPPTVQAARGASKAGRSTRRAKRCRTVRAAKGRAAKAGRAAKGKKARRAASCGTAAPKRRSAR